MTQTICQSTQGTSGDSCGDITGVKIFESATIMNCYQGPPFPIGLRHIKTHARTHARTRAHTRRDGSHVVVVLVVENS